MKTTGVRTKLYEFEQHRALGDANSPQGRKRAASLAAFVDTESGLEPAPAVVLLKIACRTRAVKLGGGAILWPEPQAPGRAGREPDGATDTPTTRRT